LRWGKEHRVEWHYRAPGNPTQIAFIESLGTSFPMKAFSISMRQASLLACQSHSSLVTDTCETYADHLK